MIDGTPQCYIDLMKKCWDLDPLKRLTASELIFIIRNWWSKFDGIKFIHENDDVRKYLENIEDEQLRKDIEEYWKADKAFEAR